ncbi:MAG: PEP-CTERM sorting domain-containing protein [Candidatus Omnitrophica bacterium]|nr:PEP-CTERM sorting domain-containing protein [Candidatus Omnitrophota bacterium]
MVKKIKDYAYNAMLIALVPLLTGCNGGGGGSTSGLGGLFASFGGGDGSGGPGVLGSAGDLASINNPEPASLLLMGSGMAALAYYKNRKK